MKKIFFLGVVILVSIAGKVSAQDLSISNNSNCTVVLRLYAHNSGGPVTCPSYVSTNISVPGFGTTMYIADPSDLDAGSCTPVCWAGGASITAGGIWDQVQLSILGGSCPGTIGSTGIGPCAPTTNTWTTTSPCCAASATWSVVGTTTYLAIQ